jgi:uncharacterized protein YjbI with pentapeptide repeats
MTELSLEGLALAIDAISDSGSSSTGSLATTKISSVNLVQNPFFKVDSRTGFPWGWTTTNGTTASLDPTNGYYVPVGTTVKVSSPIWLEDGKTLISTTLSAGVKIYNQSGSGSLLLTITDSLGSNIASSQNSLATGESRIGILGQAVNCKGIYLSISNNGLFPFYIQAAVIVQGANFPPIWTDGGSDGDAYVTYMELETAVTNLSGGTFSGPVINTPTISGGAISGATVTEETSTGSVLNTPTINTPTISNGTMSGTAISGATLGTATINTPTINTPTINTPTISGGTVSGITVSDSTFDNSTFNEATFVDLVLTGSDNQGTIIQGQTTLNGSVPKYDSELTVDGDTDPLGVPSKGWVSEQLTGANSSITALVNTVTNIQNQLVKTDAMSTTGALSLFNNGSGMAGLGLSVIPASTGKFLIIATGNFQSDSISAPATLGIIGGTGTPPTSGATPPTTPSGILINSSVTDVKIPFCFQTLLVGLNLRTTYWFDIAMVSNASGSCILSNAYLTAIEL